MWERSSLFHDHSVSPPPFTLLVNNYPFVNFFLLIEHTQTFPKEATQCHSQPLHPAQRSNVTLIYFSHLIVTLLGPYSYQTKSKLSALSPNIQWWNRSKITTRISYQEGKEWETHSLHWLKAIPKSCRIPRPRCSFY